MPVSYTVGKDRVVTRDTTGTTYVVAGNSTVSNIVGANGEIVTNANISKVWFSQPANGVITISRGANVVLYLNGTDNFNFTDGGCTIADFNAANVTIAFSAANSVLVMEMVKTSTVPGY